VCKERGFKYSRPLPVISVTPFKISFLSFLAR
jgi:hypothetical protein